jgi:hypothetical protein
MVAWTKRNAVVRVGGGNGGDSRRLDRRRKLPTNAELSNTGGYTVN